MSSKGSVYDWLNSAGLARFYTNFQREGISEGKFVNLIVSDYHGLGVTELNDRQTLFKLIQNVKRDLDNPKPRPEPSISTSISHSHGLGKTAGRQKRGSGESPAAKPGNSSQDTNPRRDGKRRGSLRLAGETAEGMSRITVCVRKRPLNSKERARGERDCASTKGDSGFIIKEPRTKVDLSRVMCSHKFFFDAVFDEKMSNEAIYRQTCKPLVHFFFEGGNATCFAYGQTGSGKTYTMMGPEGGKKEQNGLYVLAARDIFDDLQNYPQLEIYVSFFEIYGGKFFDLLNNRLKLDLREDAHGEVHIIGLREIQCHDWAEIIQMIQYGNSVRSSGVTGANVSSSRSHAILQISSRKRNGKTHGKYSFIDLAGSERAADTQKNAQKTRLEGAEINKSLLALKECIRALDQNATHRPFRGSKLTQVLKDSLIGNSRTIMIATVSPTVASVEHTLNTLRYADRVKEMKSSGSSKASKHNAYMPHSDKSNTTVTNRTTNSPGVRKKYSSMTLSKKGPSLTKAQSLKAPSKFGKANKKSSRRSNYRSATMRVSSSGSRNSRSNAQRSKSPDLCLGSRATKREVSSEDESQQHSNPSDINQSNHESNNNANFNPNVDYSSRRSFSGRMSGSVEDDSKMDMERLVKKHQQLTKRNGKMESSVLEHHRKHIHVTMLKVKQEMELLKAFEAKNVSPDEYIKSLKELLVDKIEAAEEARGILNKFQESLHEAEFLNLELEKLSM